MPELFRVLTIRNREKDSWPVEKAKIGSELPYTVQHRRRSTNSSRRSVMEVRIPAPATVTTKEYTTSENGFVESQHVDTYSGMGINSERARSQTTTRELPFFWRKYHLEWR